MAFVSKWYGFGKDERYDRGLRAFDCGLYEDAIPELAECARASTDPATARLARFYLAEAWAHLGQKALRTGDFATAARAFESAVEIQPRYPDLRYNLAAAFRGLGQIDRQRSELQAALALNPAYANAMVQQAALLYGEGRIAEAMVHLDRALAIEPGLRGEHFELFLQCHQAGDRVRALANLDAMTVRESRDANDHARLGDRFARQELWLEAAREYARALEIAPGYPDVRCKLGQALLQLDQVEDAEREFRRALEVNPRYADALAQLGVALRRLCRETEAREAFLDALEAQPHHVVAEAEVSRLRMR